MTEPALPPANDSGPIVEMNHVQLAFGHKTILRDLNLTVARRERLVIMGQSGGGKSTTLRLIMGILRPKTGIVKFKGQDVTRMNRPQLNKMRQRIGMVYQYSALISSLSVRNNLALPLEELTDKSEKEIDEIVSEKLAMVGMEDTRDYMPAELSGGMRKRIGLARSLVLDPELILFDEPSAGLDPVVSSVIDELIISLTEKTNTTSIIVTHEMDSAFRIATRMAMLYQGRIIEEDRPEVFRHSADPVVSQFVEGRTDGPIGT
ncbi:MAG TPA: ATP-binding cassette domain-containing protein [Chthoniobacteraceae bacterium]|jgi:phospholipid/cholesterol/gamma-HCH transport system ATP-binding protein|nr:ATP-binding cassette domain-containing protein [Chthoniobacteraceae bacterium]